MWMEEEVNEEDFMNQKMFWCTMQQQKMRKNAKKGKLQRLSVEQYI